MKRATIQLLTVTLALCSCQESDVEPTLQNYRLFRLLHYASSTASEPYALVNFEYDDGGNLVKESMFDWPNTLTTYKVYEYSNGTLIREKTFNGQVGNLNLGTYTNYYYTDDQVTKEELYLSDGTLVHATYYDFEGDNLINTYKEDGDLGIHHQYKYSYDNKGRLILEQVFMYNQELTNFTKYRYDDSDRMIKSELYDSDSVLTSSVEKIYHDPDSLPDEVLSYNQAGELIQRSELIYDRLGNQVGCVNKGATTCRLSSNKYNGRLLVEAITYHPYFECSEWTVTRYEYERK